MAYTLFHWHPQRGVHHFTWDSVDQVSTHIASIIQREAGWALPPLTFYVFDDSFDTWWYYCQQPKPDPKTATAMQMRMADPWQRRALEGVPKEIRAYKLLLG
jgi:catalase